MNEDLDDILEDILGDHKDTEVPRVSLQQYVETTKRLKLDPWQIDICTRLEKAFWIASADKFTFELFDYGFAPAYYEAPSGLKIDKREFDRNKNSGTRVAIHAPPQFGKSIIISQCYPAWILGYDQLHRFRLATYNAMHSARFSRVVKQLMKSPEHIKLFPDRKGLLPKQSKAQEWSTNARLDYNDGQASFSGLGLKTGFVGTGADTLLMDDPYKSAEDALSEITRDVTWRFWTDTASPRMTERSNVFIMFHRYHQDDMGGRAIATGEFDLWRYAAVADGDYEDENSGKTIVFPDPLGRKEGEFLSDRFGPTYYLRQQKNENIWYSQFQGRPSAKTGKMFNITHLQKIKRGAVPEIIHWVRAWDNAATEGGGAYSAGVLMGMDAAENVYIFDVVREQVGTAERQLLQQQTAEKDGYLVQIHVPQDPGSAGKDVAFEFQQDMSNLGYTVTVTKVNGSKEFRAYSFSKATNSQRTHLIINDDGSLPDWHKAFIHEARFFPVGTYKDQIDAGSDAYSHLVRLFYRGLVVKTKVEHTLLPWSFFSQRFGSKIQAHWEVAAAVFIAPDSSRPSGYAITTRAAENAHLGERVFIVGSGRMFVDDPIHVLNALCDDLIAYCANGVRHAGVVWLNRGAGDVVQVAAHKLELPVVEFLDESTAGIPEMNWYLQDIPQECVFYHRVPAPRAYCLVDGEQVHDAKLRNEKGQLSLRQDFRNWSYTDRGEVQPYGGVTLDCVRRTLYKFALTATSLSEEERLMSKLKPELQPAAVAAKRGTPAFIEAHFAQCHAIAEIRAAEAEEKRVATLPSNREDSYIGKQASVRRFYKGHTR